MTTNYTFPCTSVNGLTTAQKREAIKALRESIKTDVVLKREAKAMTKEAKALARAQKKAERIAKLEAKIAALKAPKVGTAARKAARKPSAVTVTRM